MNSIDELMKAVQDIASNDDFTFNYHQKEANEGAIWKNRYVSALTDVFSDLKLNIPSFEKGVAEDKSITHADVDNKLNDIYFTGDRFLCSHDPYQRQLGQKYKDVLLLYQQEMANFKQNALYQVKNLQCCLSAQRLFRPLTEEDCQIAEELITDNIKSCEMDIKRNLLNYLMFINLEHNKKKSRRNFSKDATYILTEYFNQNINKPYPDDNTKRLLAARCGLTQIQVTNWFGNKRIRDAKKAKIDKMDGNMNV
uniref:Homeobox domain-containing protein n=1 Tax=Rhabditophanes sp. KR3021 TaxID=114890 RepID=A0AC35U505_9BILA